MQLEVGSILEGKVTGITNFGAFVELSEGVTGMVHISEVAPTYVSQIKDHLTIGQEVKVKVLSVSEDGKISLSIKKAMQKPKQFNKQDRRKPNTPPPATAGPGSFEWHSKRSEPSSFEDMMNQFKQSSDEKISALKRGEPSPRRRKPQK
ncbi:MAG: S1 RNA-binding domain-containing protein [Acutalibacteraceae bacterium]